MSDEDHTVSFERGKARLNRTVSAIMQRGIDKVTAQRLHADGFTLGRLKQSDDARLKSLSLTEVQIAAIRQGARSAIPFSNLARVLWQNRFTCCVCRDPTLAVIVHHIDPWATSHDHTVENLAVLCLEHHARAHRTGTLEQNLTSRQLKECKENWEQAVSHLDPKAILDASRISGFHWWWFNHSRLLEMAERADYDFQSNPYLPAAMSAGRVNAAGMLTDSGRGSHYLYEGGDGTTLYAYMRAILESVLPRTAIYNISDDLDPGFLTQVVTANDLLVIQGRHFFKQRSAVLIGPGQTSEVRRQANSVCVSFTIDRWEAVASSSWSSWLVGSQSAASIVRVSNIARDSEGRLLLKCTGIAIGSSLQGLATRDYTSPDMPVKRYTDNNWLEEDELDDGTFGVERSE